MHDHPFHDKKIVTKGHTGNIYTSIKAASSQMEVCGHINKEVEIALENLSEQ